MVTETLAIELRGIDKSYSLESRPGRRLWQQLSGRSQGVPVHHALANVSLQVRRGEVVGIIGRNGAGKSTLLQIVCGVLQPSRGERWVNGRIAALLELGAGFNGELTGRENVRLNGPLLGLSAAQIEAKLPAIVEFAGIGEFIDQPVRSYSSGMFVRLAFSMATSVEPEILIIDEALSVGDDAFSRKSFERIMALKDRGVTILFCSHALFQVESMCQRAIWLHDGRVAFDGAAAQAVVEYKAWSERDEGGGPVAAAQHFGSSRAELLQVVFSGRAETERDNFRSTEDDLAISVRFRSELNDACPTLGVVVHGADGRAVTSAGSWMDGLLIHRDAQGLSVVELVFPRLALLKGRYTVSAYLMCERALNVLSAAEHVLRLEVQQAHLEQGVVTLPRRWHSHATAAPAKGP
jgi:lipopolysaccharide transport system ATP-binding protein